MLGKSIYLSSSIEARDKSLATIQSDDWVFVSLHSYEDFVDGFANRAFSLVDAIAARGGRVVADVCPEGVRQLGYPSLCELAKSGKIFALRLDCGFTTTEMFDAAKFCKIVINGSILDYDLINKMRSANVDIVGMHNFYPRVDSGLDENYALECTEILHSYEAKSWAFVSGDGELRGPIFEGLPTVEDYRYMHPYVQYELLRRKLKSDEIFVGDISLTDKTEQIIRRAQRDNAVILPIEDKNFPSEYLNTVLTIRADSNSRIARISESRQMSVPGRSINPSNCVERCAGFVTIDNEKYLRYSGEIEIVRKCLPADGRVNVIAKIKEEFLPLLQILDGGVKIIFVPTAKY